MFELQISGIDEHAVFFFFIIGGLVIGVRDLGSGELREFGGIDEVWEQGIEGFCDYGIGLRYWGAWRFGTGELGNLWIMGLDA